MMIDYTRPPLTAEEKAVVKDRSRWLRRVVNPFVDFNVIVAVGTAMASAPSGTSQRQDDTDAQDYMKDL